MSQPAKKSSAWKGTWDRPLKVDEASHDPLTIARMTDHNVRGSDPAAQPESDQQKADGKLTPEEAEKISSRDLPDST